MFFFPFSSKASFFFFRVSCFVFHVPSHHYTTHRHLIPYYIHSYRRTLSPLDSDGHYIHWYIHAYIPWDVIHSTLGYFFFIFTRICKCLSVSTPIHLYVYLLTHVFKSCLSCNCQFFYLLFVCCLLFLPFGFLFLPVVRVHMGLKGELTCLRWRSWSRLV